MNDGHLSLIRIIISVNYAEKVNTPGAGFEPRCADIITVEEILFHSTRQQEHRSEVVRYDQR